MAFLSSEPNKEEEEAEQGGMNTISSSQSGAIESGGGPASGAAKGGSGSFTNIQDYIKANQPKTQELSEGITSNVRKQGKALKSELGKTREDYLGEQGKFGQGAKSFVEQQTQQAGQGNQTAESVKRFRDIATGAQKGPDLTNQRGQAADLQRQAKEFGTSKGRQEGLRKTVGKRTPTYGKGQRQLDNLLLAGDKNKAKSIRDVRDATKGLSGNVDTLQTDIGSGRTDLSGFAKSSVSDARQGLRGELTNRYEGLRSGLQSGNLSQDQFDRLGLQSGQRTYAADLLGGLEQTRGMSAADTSRLDELAALGGLEGRELYTGAQGGDTAQNLQDMIASQKGLYRGEMTPHEKRLADLTGYKSDIGSMLDTARYEDITSGNRYIGGDIADKIGNKRLIADTDRSAEETRLLKQGQALGINGYDTMELGGGFRKYDRRGRTDAQNAQVYKDHFSGKLQKYFNPVNKQISDIERQYAGNLGLAAKDGGIMNPKLAALKKLRGY